MTASLTYSSAVRPCPGQSLSGDAVVIATLDDGLFLAIIDVLGHGPEANELTHVIDNYLNRFGSSDVQGLMNRLHQHLQGSRGAAVGLCAIDSSTACVSYVGIGNTVIRRFGKMDSRLISRDGVLGQNMRSPLLQTLHLEPGDTLLFYTDGVSDRFSLEDYPGILFHEAEEVANNVVSRFGKGHDDAACIAVKYSV